MTPCILCKANKTRTIYQKNEHVFHKCMCCGSVFRNPETFPGSEDEKARYLDHNNDVNDPDYQGFVSPIVNAVRADFVSPAKGLDFGAGTGPVISCLLEEDGFSMHLYDPFFHPEASVLNTTYDFIVCCEVIEHFHRPLKEFQLLHALLKPNGKLYCMTDPLPDEELFSGWYYKEDPTHVIFYSEENLGWLKKTLGFTELQQTGRMIIMQK